MSAAMSYAWVMVGVLTLAQMTESLPVHGIPTLYFAMRDDLGFSRADVGLISSGLYTGVIITALLTGWLVDRRGARFVLTVTPVFVVALVLLFSQVRSLPGAVLLAVLMSATYSGMVSGCVREIMEWVRPGARILARGIQQTSVPISGITVALLLPYLAVAYSWRVSVIVLAFIIMAVGTVVFALYRENPDSDYKGQGGNPVRSLSLVAGDQDIWLICVYSTTVSALQAVFGGYLILFLRQDLDMSAVVAGGFLAVAQASSIVWRIAWGFGTDSLLRGRRVVALALMGAMSVGSMGLLAWLPSDAPLVVVGLVVALVVGGFSGGPVIFPILLAELAGPGLTGTVIGFGRIVSGVLVISIPPLYGLVVDKTGSYDLGWLMMAGVAGVGTLLLVFLRPDARRR